MAVHRPASRFGGRRTWRDLGALVLALAATAGAAVLWYRSGLLVNHTASLPVGLYRVTRLTAAERDAAAAGRLAPLRGAVVVWCLPDDVAAVGRRRGYLLRGPCPGDVEPVLKHVAAVPGDTVVVNAGGLAVDGGLLANSRALARDARGRPTSPVPPGIYAVTAGTVWLWSPYTPRSFDSRYYGAVTASGWLGVARPLWTRRPAMPINPRAP